MWWRMAGANGTRAGWTLCIGRTTEARTGHVFLAGISGLQLRIFDDKSFALSGWQNEARVGVRLGPIEPESRVGFSLLTVDVFHGQWSAEMLAPRAGLALALRLGRLRIAADLWSEYLWRWFGTSYWDRGLGISVRFEAKKQANPFMEDSR